MKVAHVVCVFPPYRGGIGNVALNYVRYLKKHNLDITVFTPKYNNEKNVKKEAFQVEYIKPFLKYGKGAFLPQLTKKLCDFDVVHLHYPFFGTSEIVWLAKIIFSKKFKLVIHYHMDVVEPSFLIKILSIPSKLILNSLLKTSDAITCASIDYIKNSNISNFYFKNSDKFHEIPFGVDFDKFKPLEKYKSEGEKLKLLFVGGLDKAHYFKGIDVLLKALSGVKDKYELNVVGNGDLIESYKETAEKLQITNSVNFLTDLDNDELVKYYQNTDLFILPSINKCEAFGLVLIEAMATGKPVVASNLPGVRSVFKEGEHGYLFETGQSDNLIEVLNKIYLNREKLKNMGEKARGYVLHKYNWNNIANEIFDLYKKL